MKYINMPAAEEREGDNRAMAEAIAWLNANNVDVRRSPKSAYQLKVAVDLSYYPDKGSIFRDGDSAALPERGLKALLEIIEADDGRVTIARPKRRV